MINLEIPVQSLSKKVQLFDTTNNNVSMITSHNIQRN